MCYGRVCNHTHTHAHARTHAHTRAHTHAHTHAHTCAHTHFFIFLNTEVLLGCAGTVYLFGTVAAWMPLTPCQRAVLMARAPASGLHALAQLL